MGQSGVPLKSSRYPYSVIPGHPLAHADGRVRIHRAVLYDAIGPGAHPCHWCGDLLTWKENLVVDHIDADTWNNDPSNLVPSCSSCNSRRATYVRGGRGGNASKTHCKNGHEFTEENTYWRKNRATKSGRSRQCKQCGRDRARARQEALPRRTELTVPLRGLTVANLRDFVSQTTHLAGDTPVFTSYREDS